MEIGQFASRIVPQMISGGLATRDVRGWAVEPSSCVRNQSDALIARLRSGVLAQPLFVERLHAVFLDRHHSFVGDIRLGTGHAGALSLKLRDLFTRALALNASGMIIAHNHPSGDCRPSHADHAATQRVAAVARALDIELLDHLIFTHDAIYSIRAGGKL